VAARDGAYVPGTDDIALARSQSEKEIAPPKRRKWGVDGIGNDRRSAFGVYHE